MRALLSLILMSCGVIGTLIGGIAIIFVTAMTPPHVDDGWVYIMGSSPILLFFCGYLIKNNKAKGDNKLKQENW